MYCQATKQTDGIVNDCQAIRKVGRNCYRSTCQLFKYSFRLYLNCEKPVAAFEN